MTHWKLKTGMYIKTFPPRRLQPIPDVFSNSKLILTETEYAVIVSISDRYNHNYTWCSCERLLKGFNFYHVMKSLSNWCPFDGAVGHKKSEEMANQIVVFILTSSINLGFLEMSKNDSIIGK